MLTAMHWKDSRIYRVLLRGTGMGYKLITLDDLVFILYLIYIGTANIVNKKRYNQTCEQ